MEKHFICTGGCGGSSAEAGAVCQAENCPHKGQAMEECNCTDGFHKQGTQQDVGESDGGDI